jgi:hypothetical protein
LLTTTQILLLIHTVFQAIAITKKENEELKLKAAQSNNQVAPASQFEGGA